MKQKNKKILSLFAAFIVACSAFASTACDMIFVNDQITEGSDSGSDVDDGSNSGSNGSDVDSGSNSGSNNGRGIILSEDERDNLEKTGRFLKLICMPENTQVSNVFSVIVANSSSNIGKLDDKKPICIYIENFSANVYIPLVYNDGSEFLETGSFFTAFTIHVDAVKKYVVDINDKILVDYKNGRGTFDVRNINQTGQSPADIRYLTIFNLPVGFSSRGVSKVLVHNMYNPIALCMDYSRVEVFKENGSASVKIPLSYNDKSTFDATGKFFVSFELYCDAASHYSVAPEDRYFVSFIDGNGFIDINNLEFESLPYLTISGLPLNLTKYHFSNVSVYNLVGTVASCNPKDIVILKDSSYSTAVIPLSGNNEGYFRDTGNFLITFTINIDVLTQISFKRDDRLILDFIQGNASLDYAATLGFFKAELANPSDTSAPVVKKDSTFEVGGIIRSVNSNTVINSPIPNSNGFLYIYAYALENEIFFEYSSVEPVYNQSKKGYYYGNKRALWKMFILNIPPSFSSGQTQNFFFKKTYIDNSWGGIEYFTVDNQTLINYFSSSAPVYSLNGGNNPQPASVTLNPGVYLVSLKGAGGGSSYNLPSKRKTVASLYFAGSSAFNNTAYFSLDYKTDNYFFNSLFITQAFYSYLNIFNFTDYLILDNCSPNDAVSTMDYIQNLQIFYPDFKYYYSPDFYLPLAEAVVGGDGGFVAELLFVGETSTFTAFTGEGGKSSSLPTCGIASGGGGGGSGSFLYNSRDNYLLCAGGGGGAAGVSSLSPGGSGGDGGSIGSGAGGGASGYSSETARDIGNGQVSYYSADSDQNYIYNYNVNSTRNFSFSSDGGNGGGFNGGNGGALRNTYDINFKNGNNGDCFINGNFSFTQSKPFQNPYTSNVINATVPLTHLFLYNRSNVGTNFFPNFKTNLTISYNTLLSSGSGGSAAFNVSTSNVNGQGGKAPKLPDNPFISKNKITKYVYDVLPSNADNKIYSAFPFEEAAFYHLYNFSYAARDNSINGGNNRNSARGGGSDGGSKLLPVSGDSTAVDRRDSSGQNGSVAIYKIQ